MTNQGLRWIGVCFLAILPIATSVAERLPLEGPALGPQQDRIRQAEIESGELSLRELRLAGLRVFATPFRRADGFGDGPMNPGDPTSLGGRPTLGPGPVFLRVNGLDSQTCIECHNFVSTTTFPPRFGIGGFGSVVASPFFMPKTIDVADVESNGFAGFDGRLILPPHLFGVGGVQLLGREMTMELLRLADQARANPGLDVALVTKGVSFGSIRAEPDGVLRTEGVEGVDSDLVVRPFGRKGEFATVGAFDRGALQFHMGMEPDETVGEGADADGDGIAGEILIGELSALEIFLTTMDRPVQLFPRGTFDGRRIFHETGCAECHRPALKTRSRRLPFSSPLIPEDPAQNVYYEVDLSVPPASFRVTPEGGLVVPLFSDLKRHDMGSGLAEQFHGATERGNREFVTAKLWGVGDSAPYLHDGRAHTLAEAIEMHGGEAEEASLAFGRLEAEERIELLEFLRSLRLPRQPNGDLGSP